MKYLVIPDVHQRVGLIEKKVLALEPHDAVIWLGDWFDNFNDTVGEATETAVFLRCRMKEHPEDLFLLGNHDAHYAFPFEGFRCSGYTYAKMKAIRNVLGSDEWARFNLFVQVDGWTLSHAGFHSDLAHPKSGFTDIEWMAEQECAALNQAAHGKVHPWLAAGVSRGGWAATGGVTWLDWNDEFRPIEGINQIVGHTPGDAPRRRTRKRGMVSKVSINWNIDTHSHHYGVLENGTFTTRQTPQV